MERLFCSFVITECRIHGAMSLQVRSQVTVSCSQHEYSGLLMSLKMVDWVCRGVVVLRGPSPLSEKGFGFLVSGSSCLLPDLTRRSALLFPGIPQCAGVTVGPLSILVGEAAGLSAAGELAGQRY